MKNEVKLRLDEPFLMENEVDRWLNFAVKVEREFENMSNDIFSESYKTGVYSLVNQIQYWAKTIPSIGSTERKQCYFKINVLGQELKNLAYFMIC